MFPCDEPEQDRLDLFHKMLRVARREQLHFAPVNRPNVKTTGDPGSRILDLGCGTGIVSDPRKIFVSVSFGLLPVQTNWLISRDSGQWIWRENIRMRR